MNDIKPTKNRKKTQFDLWKETIQDLSDKNLIPPKWTNPKQLADFLVLIDPFLLTFTPIRIHDILGKSKRKKSRLTLGKAQELMLCPEWETIKEQILKSTVVEDVKRIKRQAMFKLEERVAEGDLSAIRLTIELDDTGILQKNVNVKHIDNKEKAKKFGKLALDYLKIFKQNDVEQLEGNH